MSLYFLYIVNGLFPPVTCPYTVLWLSYYIYKFLSPAQYLSYFGGEVTSLGPRPCWRSAGFSHALSVSEWRGTVHKCGTHAIYNVLPAIPDNSHTVAFYLHYPNPSGLVLHYAKDVFVKQRRRRRCSFTPSIHGDLAWSWQMGARLEKNDFSDRAGDGKGQTSSRAWL